MKSKIHELQNKLYSAMSKNFIRLLTVLLFFLFSDTLFAQWEFNPRQHVNVPFGQSAVYTEYRGRGPGGEPDESFCFVTKKKVTLNGSEIFVVPMNLTLNADIVSVEHKEFTTDFLVQLSNGAAFQLRAKSSGGWETVVLDFAGAGFARKMVGDDLYIMTYNAVFVSDSGYNWVIDTAGLDLNGAYCNDIDMDTTQKVWLATQNGLFTQLLNVMTWIKNTGYGNSNAGVVHVDRAQKVWVADYNVLKVSSDGGTTFPNAPTGLPNYYIRKITDDAFGNIYVMFDSMLYYSQGGTQPFVKVSQPLMADFALMGTQYLFNDVTGDTTVYLATNAGLYASGNQGSTWTYIDTASRADQINSVAATSDNRLLMTSTVGAFRLEANQTWSKRYPQNGFLADTKAYVAGNGDVYLAAENNGVNSGNDFRRMVYKSSDNGTTFIIDTAGLTASDVGMSGFFVDESGVQHAMAFVYVSGGPGELRVWKKNPGQPWVLDTIGLSASLSSNHSSQCFGTGHNGKVYVAIRSGGSVTIYSRTLAGNNWTQETVINASVIYIKGRNGKVVVGTDMGLVYTTGSGWNSASNPSVVTGAVTWSISEVDNNGVVWAYFETVDNNGSIGEGVYYTTDFVNWREPEGNMDTILFRELVAVGDSVFALTLNSGVYVYDTLHPVQVGVKETASADGIRIVPNPFSNHTTMQFDLTTESRISLNIYNVLGETVFNIPAQQMSAGTQQLKINLPTAAYGVLLYELNISGTVRRGKLMQQ